MKKVFTYIALAVALIAVLFGGTILYVLSFYDTEAQDVHECGVVFGAAVWPGGVASHALADRVHEGIDLYEAGLVRCLIFSGAPSAYGKHEVEVMDDVARERGVPTEVIEKDFGGDNTLHTLLNLNRERSYIFVSNDFHLARIAMLAKRLNLSDFELQRSEYRSGRYTRESFFVFREAVAFWYYALMPQQAFMH